MGIAPNSREAKNKMKIYLFAAAVALTSALPAKAAAKHKWWTEVCWQVYPVTMKTI